MVTPVTTKCIPELKRAKTKVWLPEGTWFDFFNGMIYEGGRSMDLYRTLEEIPVLAKARCDHPDDREDQCAGCRI